MKSKNYLLNQNDEKQKLINKNENGEFTRSTTEFYTTLEKNGYKKIIEKRIKYIKGLRLMITDSACDDFLT